MSSDWYTLLSMGMRYWFAILVAIIVYRAWRATIRDNRRARILRSWAPDTGAIGEIVVVGGGSGVKKGSRIPVPKEGLLGSSRRADVRLKHPDVKRYHAHIEQRENGVLVETLGDGEIWLNGRTGEKLLLRDGDRFMIGSLSMMLVLYEPGAIPARDGPDTQEDDELFSPPGISVHAKARPSREKPPAKKTRSVSPKRESAQRRSFTEEELFPPFEDGFEARMDTQRKTRGKVSDDEVKWWPDEKR